MERDNFTSTFIFIVVTLMISLQQSLFEEGLWFLTPRLLIRLIKYNKIMYNQCTIFRKFLRYLVALFVLSRKHPHIPIACVYNT